MKIKGSKCSKCGEFISDLDVGFSPADLKMAHECGGKWVHHVFDTTEKRPCKPTGETSSAQPSSR